MLHLHLQIQILNCQAKMTIQVEFVEKLFHYQITLCPPGIQTSLLIVNILVSKVSNTLNVVFEFFICYLRDMRSQDSSVVWHWDMGFMIVALSPSRGWELFSSPLCSDQLRGPPNLLSKGYQGFLPGGGEVKWPGHEADHSPPSNAESRMCGAICPLPQYAFMVWCLVKAQGQLHLLFAGHA
jgi:hypothetical protein